MQKNNHPQKGCGTNREITGCQFSLSVMSDNYVDLILSSLKNVDTTKVWSATDLLSTTYRGKRIHVVDTLKGVFTTINDEKTHITLEATFSKGCPCDIDGDSVFSEAETLPTKNDAKFLVHSKIAFYPMGITDYMEHITKVINMAKKRNIYKASSHYASELEGDVNDIFDYFDDVLDYAEKNIAHYVLQATLSVNSPSLKGGYRNV